MRGLGKSGRVLTAAAGWSSASVRGADGSGRGQDVDGGVVVGEVEFPGGAEHPLGQDAADGSLLERPGAGHLGGGVDDAGARESERDVAADFDVRTALEAAGLRPGTETVAHCQAGIRTTMAVLVLALLGWDRVRAYEASLAERANRDDTPLVVETAKGCR